MATTAITMVPLTTPKKKAVDHYMHTCVRGLSVPQVIFGFVCVIFQAVLIIFRSRIYYVGQGIWAGTMFIICGVLGILSSRIKTMASIVAFLMMAVFVLVPVVGLVSASAIQLALTDINDHHDDYERSAMSITLDAIMIAIAVVQAILAIISSAFACHGLCGGNQEQNVMVAGQVHYITGADGQQQVVIVPLGQQGPGIQTPLIPGSSGMVLPAASGSAPNAPQPMQTPQYKGPEGSPPHNDPSNETKMPVLQ